MLFLKLKDNERIKQQLCAFEKNNSFPHALIIDGGTEKDRYILSNIISSWAVCNAEGEKPCGKCSSCLKLKSESHPDVIRITGGSSARSFHVDSIRGIRKDAYIIPNEASKKVYVFENAESMTIQAQNALLKILEEPPKNVIFILTCESSSSLLLTVRSRAQVLSLKLNKEDPQICKKAFEVCNNISIATIASKEYELLVATAPLIKNKALVKDVLTGMHSIFGGACVLSSGGEPLFSQEVMYQLSQRLTLKRLVFLVKVVEECIDMLNGNVNLNILITYFCIEIRKAAIL